MFGGNIDKIVIPEGEVYSIESNGLTIWTIAKYLSVTPVDVQGISPDNELVYEVKSNTTGTVSPNDVGEYPEENYLYVTPTEVQGVTPENEITYQVTSNIDGTIT